jgi:hypothetical protein
MIANPATAELARAGASLFAFRVCLSSGAALPEGLAKITVLNRNSETAKIPLPCFVRLADGVFLSMFVGLAKIPIFASPSGRAAPHS